jgi:uncharacterized membrane protein YfhO
LLQESGWRVLAEDKDQVVYDFILGGMQRLGPVTVFQNEAVFPRAFVVPESEPLPERSRILSALKTTNFRHKVFLEGGPTGLDSRNPQGEFRQAAILEEQPNRVTIQVSGDTPGVLVLTDIWFPGWTARIDDEQVPVYRANYLFRAVTVPAGNHIVVFAFEPNSYRWGKIISGLALAFVGGMTLLCGVYSSWIGRRRLNARVFRGT